MTITVDAGAAAALASDARAFHFLVELDFTTGTVRYTTAPLSIGPFVGLGELADVSIVSESEDPNQEQVVLGLSLGASNAVLAATLGAVENYRGRPVRVYVQFTDANCQPAGTHVLRFQGTMEPISVTRTKDASTGASTARVEMRCSRSGLSRSRNALGLRLTHAQQQLRFPGDRGLERLQLLVEKPSLWLSKAFQEER